MSEASFNSVFGPRSAGEQGNEEGDSFWKAFKFNFIIVAFVFAAYVIYLLLARIIPLFGVIGIVGIFIIIGGLPALGILNFIQAGVQKAKGKNSLAKGYATCGVIALLLYGGCWVVLFGALGGL